MRIIYEADGAAVQQSCHEILDAAGLDWEDVDLLVSGFNGDEEQAGLYEAIEASALRGGGHIRYKHLVGQYGTSTGFGLWLSSLIVAEGTIYPKLPHTGKPRNLVKTALLVNNQEQETASVMLIRSTVR